MSVVPTTNGQAEVSAERRAQDPPKWVRWAPAILLALVILCYTRAVQFEFVYDDLIVVLKNPNLEHWSSIPTYFTTHVYGQFNTANVHSNIYRPVFLLWFFLNYQLFHTSPMGWHFTNLLVYLVSVWMMYRVSLRLMPSQMCALASSAMWAVHPLHVESVAWVCGVTDPMLSVPLFGAMLCHFNYRRGDGGKWLGFAAVLFAVATFTKETSIILPPLLLLYDWFFVRKETGGWTAAGRRLLPTFFLYCGIELFYLFCRYCALGAISEPISKLEPQTILLTIPSVLSFYFGKMFWPVDLSLFYDFFYVVTPVWDLFWAPLLALVVGFILSAAWVMRSRDRGLLVLAFAMLVLPILPVLNFQGFQWRDLAHDRYLYLPTVGFAWIITLIIWRVINWVENLKTSQVPNLRSQTCFAITTGVIVLALATATYAQVPVWRNQRSLYENAAHRSPNNLQAVTGLANELAKVNDWDNALPLYQRAMVQAPQDWMAHFTVGSILVGKGGFAEAETVLLQAIEIDQGRDAREFILLGDAQTGQKKFSDAETSFQRAAQIEPQSAGIRVKLGDALLAQGKKSDAITAFRDALVVNPNYQPAKDALAAAEKSR